VGPAARRLRESTSIVKSGTLSAVYVSIRMGCEHITPAPGVAAG
jgi:hypothetical protein